MTVDSLLLNLQLRRPVRVDPLDDHLLADIGLSRSYVGRRVSRRGR